MRDADTGDADAPLLSFVIPTFNRLECLRLLVDSLLAQMAATNAARCKVELLVGNNASSDGTAAYLDGLRQPGQLRIIHHAENLGPDVNTIECFEQARGKYVWVCGDDDLPLPGVLALLVEFLEREQPDLLYLPAQWHKGKLDAYLQQQPAVGLPRRVDMMTLAVQANAYVTFISSWIVNRSTYRACAGANPARYQGTSLPQLDWTLGLLKRGRGLFIAPRHWLIARAANSGGYPVFKVFVDNFNRILDDKLADSPALRRFLRDFMLRSYLPGLVWSLRQDSAGRFASLDSQALMRAVRTVWRDEPGFAALLEGVTHWPKPMARLAFGASWLCCRAWLLWLASTRRAMVPQ